MCLSKDSFGEDTETQHARSVRYPGDHDGRDESDEG
jgi:hypothetical protein